MYTIAICDDEQKEVDKIVILLKKYIENNKLECNIKTFLSAKKLYCCINTGYIPDILFLDVYMEQENGLEVAKKLRQIGFENNIVFITTSKDHALEAYGVNAIQYLVKPLKEQQLFSIIKISKGNRAVYYITCRGYVGAHSNMQHYILRITKKLSVYSFN